MNLKEYLSQKTKAKGKTKDWLPFCTLEVKTGKLWAGDPNHIHDGCVVKVPSGKYVVEGIGIACGRDRFVSRLRVRLKTAKNPTLGKELGNAGTDFGTIGVCEIDAFEAAFKKDGGADQVQAAVDSVMGGDIGILTVPEFPDAIMPYVPTGSDGSGPVIAVMSGGKRAGIELPFMEEEDVD
jgi:hypothetical protein